MYDTDRSKRTAQSNGINLLELEYDNDTHDDGVHLMVHAAKGAMRVKQLDSQS